MVATDAVYDVLGIGFGPASLAVAIAFAESDQPIRAGFIDVRCASLALADRPQMHDRFAWRTARIARLRVLTPRRPGHDARRREDADQLPEGPGDPAQS